MGGSFRSHQWSKEERKIVLVPSRNSFQIKSYQNSNILQILHLPGPGVTWGSGHHRNMSSSSQLKASRHVRCFHFTSPGSKLQPFKVTSRTAGSSPLLHPFGEFVHERFVMQPVTNTHVLRQPTPPAASRMPSPPPSLRPPELPLPSALLTHHESLDNSWKDHLRIVFNNGLHVV